jgi:hypothetical protein
MKANKIGALFLVSVLALTAVGTSYAMWSEIITIDGSINVGSLDFEWSVEDTYDSESPEKDDASSITATTSENTMTVTITNAYPCITYSLEFDIHCVGNVPVHFDDFYFVEDYARQWVQDGIISIQPYQSSGFITETQLHQCNEWNGLLTFHFDNDDEFDQGETYTFTVTLFGYQYNEPCDGTTPEKVLNLPLGVIAGGLRLNGGQYEPGNEGYGSASNPPITQLTYFDLLLQNFPAGYDVGNGYWPGFCADSTVLIYTGNNYNVQLYDSRDPMLPAYANNDEQWDKVNFLLNHWDDVAPGAHWKTLQAAIWYFTDATPGGDFNSYRNYNLADYNALIAYVDANGVGFSPGPGEWLAVVCIINSGVQLSFIVVDP